jgi:hypothetical protein
MAKIVMCILVVVKESRASKHNSLWLDSYWSSSWEAVLEKLAAPWAPVIEYTRYACLTLCGKVT